MNRILGEFFKDEYSKFQESLISDWAIDRGCFRSYSNWIKAIHKRQLSLACIATIIGQKAPRNEYAEGIIETSCLGLILAIKGLENPSCVLLRQIIELTLKHIYFSSHPIEYNWASTRESYKELTFQALLEFVRKTDEYRTFAHGPEICEIIERWFGKLSRYVHVQSRGFIGYKKVRGKYRTNEEIIRRINEVTKELWPILTALLVIFFPRKYFKSSEIEKRLIRNVLPKRLKDMVAVYLRNYESV